MEPVLSLLHVIIQIFLGSLHFNFGLHQANNFELWCSHQNTPCNIAIRIVITMPRERGKPRHGSAWYTFAARQKRQQRLERALSMAKTQIARRARISWSPPMAFVEEVLPEEPLQIPPEPLLFTVPENWQPSSSLPGEVTKAVTVESQGHSTMEEFPTCYIEEEFPEELLHMASQDAAIAASHNSSRVMGSDTDQEKQVEEQGQGAAREQQSGEATSEAAKTKRVARRRRVAKSLRHLPFRPCRNNGVSHHHSSTRSIWN
jgi:hypothetical protein